MTDTQASLFDGPALRDEALTRVAEHANPDWYTAAQQALTAIPAGTTFTTDDLWATPTASGHTTHEPRALGAVIRHAARNRLIAPTGQYQPSVRPECHARPIPLWTRTTHPAPVAR